MSPAELELADPLQHAVDDRLEEGLRAIETQATVLMKEVAREVWRASSKDVRPEQERIVSILSRDQAIKSLIASSDERFQALAVRGARLEDHLEELAVSERRTREAMEAAATSIREIAESPTLHGVDVVRTQLEQVERHIAEAFAHFDARDEAIATQILTQVRDHGELIANETSRVVESMQSYVQNGTEAVGRLAQRVEEHAAGVPAAGLEHRRARPRDDGGATDGPDRADRDGPREGRHARPRAGAAARLDRAPDRRPRPRPGRADPLGLDRAPRPDRGAGAGRGHDPGRLAGRGDVPAGGRRAHERVRGDRAGADGEPRADPHRAGARAVERGHAPPSSATSSG